MTEHLAVIIDLSDYYAGAWPKAPHPGCEWIAREDRPTLLHTDAESAEREAIRLQRMHPNGRFAIFTATHCTDLQQVASHVNLAGEPLHMERVSRLVPIVDERINGEQTL